MICNTYIEFFKTISDKSRVEILFLLTNNKLCVQDICKELGLEQTQTSHNLNLLKKRGFTTSHPAGKKRIYELTPEAKRLLVVMDDYIRKYFHEACRCKLATRRLQQ